jgi:hypothetical protein
MAVAVTVISPVTSDMYETVTAKVMPDGKLPTGCRLHIAGPFEDQWRVITVWDEADQFHQFRAKTLLPAISEAGGPANQPPEISVEPVHRLIT